MKEQNFNPAIKAVVSIRHFAQAAVDNWNVIKSSGETLKTKLEEATNMVDDYGSDETRKEWNHELKKCFKERESLQKIMANAVSKIKGKSSENLTEEWNKYPNYVVKIEQCYNHLIELGTKCLPEKEKDKWDSLWGNILSTHQKMKNEAEASSLQLKLIEDYDPKEIDELTKTILKHIPFKYSVEDAHKFTEEYLQAYEDIKKEASQKKNLWDKLLDILAGGTEQAPEQRVMMQRWVNGEKGELHN